MNGARSIAFVDVDETLVHAKTMAAFWHWWAGQEGGGLFERIKREHSHRAAQNRAYYRAFAGVPHDELLRAGRRWYAEFRRSSGIFVPSTLDRVLRHRSAGHPVVLVSGSHRACLDPIADEIGAAAVLCAEQLVDGEGMLTGEIVRPVIGETKAVVTREVLARRRVRAEDCFAYGDHATDLPMLRAVGNPVVVGDDPVLLRHVYSDGWSWLERGGRSAGSVAGIAEFVPTQQVPDGAATWPRLEKSRR